MAETIAPSQTPAQSSSVRESASPRGPETDVQPVAVPFGQNLSGILRRAKLDMGLLAPAEILTLQRTIGNQGVLRLLAGARQRQRNGEALQAKLTTGAPDDVYEKEADSVADQVMSNSSTLLRQGAAAGAAGSDDDPEKRTSTQAVPELRRKCACGGGSEEECPDCRMKRVEVQRLSAGGDAGLEAPSMVEDVLATPGQPLAESVRRTLEPGFGHDFSHVRVHEGSKPAESAAAVNAVAYTVGNHIVFGEGQYAPGTTAGQHLLAHELTHTIQQTGGRPLGSHLARLAQAKSGLVQRDADSLDQDYNAALQSGNWQDAAEKLNGFNKEDIQSRLSQLTPDQVAKLHQGALDNPRVGPDSQVAQLTAATPANQPPASAPAAGQTAVGGPEQPPNGATTPSGAGTGPNSSTGTGLIVEDDASNLSPGQMKKSDFLSQLRQPVSDAVRGAPNGSGGEPTGGAAIEPWFQHYAGQGAQELESSIQSSVPGAGKVADAASYVPLVSAQVARAIGDSSTTGTVPPGLPAALPGVSPTTGGAVSGAPQSAQNPVSNTGGMLLKAKEGGARVADDPRAIQTQLGGGEPLEGSLQGRMSSVFGYDFSGVRVHKDNQAARLSADLNARAFTVGRNVAFGAGEYQPGSLMGDALIAHELAHIVQQGGTSAHEPLQKGGAETGSLEEDADVSAVRAVVSLWSGMKAGLANVGRNALPALKSGLKLQRCSQTVKRCPKGYSWRVQSTAGMGSFDSLCYWKCLPGEPSTPSPTATIRCDPEMNCDTGVRYEQLDSSYTKTGYGATFTPLGEQAYTGCFPLDLDGKKISDVPLRPTDFEMTDVAGPLADMAAAAKNKAKPRLDPTTGKPLPDQSEPSTGHDGKPQTNIVGNLGVDVQVGTLRANDYRDKFDAGKDRNVAFADYDVGAKRGTLVGVSGKAERKGTVPVPADPQLPTLVVGHDRSLDSEKKVLEELTVIIGDNPEATGSVNLFSERTVCAGCSLAISQFQKKYPRIVLNVVSGRK